MSDDKTKSAEERRTINVNEDHETRDWAKSLGVSEDELRKAVAAVGTSATAVREHLRRSADVRLSESGAVLGRPDLEHGAYGMVKGKTGGEAPSPDERAIRGLGPNTLPIDKQ